MALSYIGKRVNNKIYNELTDPEAMWDAAKIRELSMGTNAVLTPLYIKDVYVHISSTRMVKYGFLNYLMMYKNKDNQIITEWVELKPTEKWIDAKVPMSYEGRILIKNSDGKVKKVYSFGNVEAISKNSPKMNMRSGIDGGLMNTSGDDFVCFTFTKYSVTVKEKRCPCKDHTYSQIGICTCLRGKPQPGYNTEVLIEVEIDCSEIPVEDPIDLGGAPTGSNHGQSSGNGGGSTVPGDYQPSNCNPDPNYVVPSTPPPPGTEYVLPCSEIQIPTEEIPGNEPQEPVPTMTDVELLITWYNTDPEITFHLSAEEMLFLNNNNEIATRLVSYLSSELIEVKGFGKWAIGYLTVNPNVSFDFFENQYILSFFNPLFDYSNLDNPIFTIDDVVQMPVGFDFQFQEFSAILNPPIRRIGSVESRKNTQDMEWGYDGDISGILHNMPYFTDQALFHEVEDLFHKTSTGVLETVGDEMISRFRNKVGGTYSNPNLSQQVFESNKFKKFIINFGEKLHLALTNANWNIDNVDELVIPLSQRPVFNGVYNKFNGLQILINDTEETIIELTGFTINTATHKWKANINVTIKDHFGLDKLDALTYQNYHAGFAAWWLLQHQRGYKPFKTEIKFNMDLIANEL